MQDTWEPRHDRPAVFFFDLDGTLTDPRPGIVRCMKHALGALGAACPADDTLASFIGPSLRGTFATLLGTTDTELIERAMSRYREQYGVTGLFENLVYPGIPEMLEAACRTVSTAFVVTLKPTVYADRIVRHFGLDRHFARVYGAEMAERFEDKRVLLADMLAKEHIAPATAVMIGDRAGDIVAAREHGVPSIGVLWGYGSEAELRDAGADRLCSTPAELAARLLGR